MRVSSYPFIPDLPGLNDFKGTVFHSEGFDSGAGWKGKNALIVGTGSSANDIAMDLHSHGVNTTLIQRGSTTVVSINPSARLNEAIYDEGGLHDDTDLIVASATPPLTLKGYKAVAQRMLELDKDLIEGLKAIGFKHDMGEDEAGHQMKYFRRGGGYNLDAGSSALMAKGEIGLLQFEYDRALRRGRRAVERRKNGSRRSDHSGDRIFPATGVGAPRVGRCRRREDWRGLGHWAEWRSEQHVQAHGSARRVVHRRRDRAVSIHSKCLALQIKAMELGLLGPLSALPQAMAQEGYSARVSAPWTQPVSHAKPALAWPAGRYAQRQIPPAHRQSRSPPPPTQG